jgi:ATP-dependent Lhr-like helicase
MIQNIFHPITARWFQTKFSGPTEPQQTGWPEIVAGRHTLIAAPTGSGKTLAAFLVCIDRLLRQGIEGSLRDETQIVYVSPLKALSNDVRRNLEVPMREIRELATAEGIELPELRVLVRTGDTPAKDRQAMTRRPPHIVVTTPESLYIMLTAGRGRELLQTTRTVIVDEIHALARDKRGSHLALSLERLAALCPNPLVRIGLSATVRPIEQVAEFLVGVEHHTNDHSTPQCRIVDSGHIRQLDLGVEVPPSELEAVCSLEQWGEVYERIKELIAQHRSTLIFVNTRRLAERVAHNLRQQLGDESVAAHHGSMSREIRLDAEERLKTGRLKAIVATASLELGIDIGFIDLVCQIGSPRSIATMLQRVGRAGHSLNRTPKGRLFPLTRDELLESLALLRAVRARRLDAIEPPIAPLDILAQQIVAAVACEEWKEDDLYALCRRAWPYRQLSRPDFDAIMEMLGEGIVPARRRGAYLHRDRVNGRVRARRNARISAITSGGAIPETGDYRVVTEGDRTFVGSVNEDFAIESMAGDVFILGNTSWRIAYVRAGEVVVNDAQGAPASIPFWLGEAPGRTVELSEEVSRLREDLEELIAKEGSRESRVEEEGSRQSAVGSRGSDESNEVIVRSHNYEYRIVSGSEGMATRDGIGGDGVRDNERVSQARDLRPDQPDSALGNVSPREHRGGLRAEQPNGLHPLSSNCTRESQRTGDAFDAGRPSSHLRASGHFERAPAVGRHRTDVALPDTKAAGGVNEKGSRESPADSREKNDRNRDIQHENHDSTSRTDEIEQMPAGCPKDQQQSRLPTADCRLPSSWLQAECSVGEWPALQAVRYVAAQRIAIGLVPTQKRIVYERFFDEAGGMQLVIHAPFGGRINRAWGLAMRKRFCRSFDFELQAAANDNGIVLSLGPQHSFPIDDMFRMLRPDNGEHMLTQALLAVPMFGTRWRWNTTRALGVLRMNGGKRVPAYLQRFRAEDLLTGVFPAQTACLENRPEDIEIPDHPLVRQTVLDCLREAMDLDRWLGVLRDIADGKIELVARDTLEASPFSHEILNSNPYTFLDDAPLEERRARAVTLRRSISVESARDLGRLDPEAISQVRAEAWPLVRDADELHDALLLMTALPAAEGEAWADWFDELVAAGRATVGRCPSGLLLWVATERWPLVQLAFPGIVADPPVAPAFQLEGGASQSELSSGPAWLALVRGRLECKGPVFASGIAADFESDVSPIQAALEALEGEGFALRGRFSDASNGSGEVEWCERRLLARIHRRTLEGLRQQIRPVELEHYVRFLLQHQHLTERTQLQGRRALPQVIEQLQGFEIPAGAWEHELLPARLNAYEPNWLDELSLSGHVAWGRLAPRRRADSRPSRAGMTRVVPIALVFREDMGWLAPKADEEGNAVPLRAGAQEVLNALTTGGALFPADLQSITGLLPTQLEEALGELSALGLVTADGFAAIRGIVSRGRQSRFGQGRSSGVRRLARWGRLASRSHDSGGRWSLFTRPAQSMASDERAERWAWQLLQRYGVVFRDLLVRESLSPRWRDLAQAYRRLEARGEIRGGRFVAGVAGEQFALPDAVEQLRRIRDNATDPNKASAGTPKGNAIASPSESTVVISACDPVNLFGIITHDPRIPATRRNRIAIRDGRMAASIEAGVVKFHGTFEPDVAEEMERALSQSALTRMRHKFSPSTSTLPRTRDGVP